CLKCQGWNHIAWECLQEKDTCATCGGNHRSSSCSTTNKTWCISCASLTHCSWDRGCSVFRTKCWEMEKCNPEAHLPYYPTKEAYT
ncbi:hypothetical protein BDQ17DRAFT_1172144, partial [Cyathus striatus]